MGNSNLTIINIKQLAGIISDNQLLKKGVEMNELSVLENAYLTVKDGLISDFGIMSDFNFSNSNNIFDAKHGIVLPCWNDSHTHLVFAKSREKEFIDIINGSKRRWNIKLCQTLGKY